MNTLSQDYEVSKLLAMADNVSTRNQAYKRARRSNNEASEYGKLNASINDLAQAAEKCRKAEQNGAQP